VGATRRMVLAAFLFEACFFAMIGGSIGLIVGRVMAIGAERLVAGTVRSLYVTGEPDTLHLSWSAVLTGLGLSLVVSLLAALGPALAASRVAPVEAMARGRQEYVVAIRARHLLPGATVLFIIAAILTKLPPLGREPIAGYGSVLAAIAGTATTIPYIVRLTAAPRRLGVEACLAMSSLRAGIGRTSVLTAALGIAVAMTASVGIMVGSFRETLTVWLNSQLQADLYLRPAGTAGADRYPVMSAAIADAIQRIPGVAEVDRYRAYPIDYDGLPATLAGGEASRIIQLPMQHVLHGETRDSIRRKLNSGDYALISEPFANKHKVHPGSVLHRLLRRSSSESAASASSSARISIPFARVPRIAYSKGTSTASPPRFAYWRLRA
jgi:putative ABC transport system permease protein